MVSLTASALQLSFCLFVLRIFICVSVMQDTVKAIAAAGEDNPMSSEQSKIAETCICTYILYSCILDAVCITSLCFHVVNTVLRLSLACVLLTSVILSSCWSLALYSSHPPTGVDRLSCV